MTINGYASWLLKLLIWREARNQPHDAMVGVKHVVLNRVETAKYPIASYEQQVISIILAPAQFSCFLSPHLAELLISKGNPANYLNDIANALVFPIPGNREWESWLGVSAVVDSDTSDPTNGSTHYHSFSDQHKYPIWCNDRIPALLVPKPLDFQTQLGNLRFYK